METIQTVFSVLAEIVVILGGFFCFGMLVGAMIRNGGRDEEG